MRCQIGILFFILCLLGCNSEKKNIHEIGVNKELYIIDIDKAEKVKEFFLSEICSNMKTIILETNENVLIGQVGGVQVYKDYIFVLDGSKNVALYVFNMEGQFIRKYGSRGNGPGEYLSIEDFTIDTENEIIYLMDGDADQILLYDIHTGKYVNKIKLEIRTYNCTHIQYINEKLYTDINYWRISDAGCMLQEIDLSTGKQKQCWLDPQKYNMGWNGGIATKRRMEESFFYGRHQEFCKYIQYFSDTIISIGKNQIEPYAVVKEKKWITSKNLSKIIEESNNDIFKIDQALIDKECSYNIHSFAEWNDFISFFYTRQYDKYFVLYNKKTGKTRIARQLINDLGYDKPFFVNNFTCFDENGIYEIVGIFAINYYLEIIKKDKILKAGLDKYEQLINLPEDTNPIIFYYGLKKE